MKQITLDKYTKAAATDYADNEAEIRGFERGGEKWKSAFKEYIGFAIGTMSIGRNPRVSHYKVYTSLYPEIFGEGGFAGRVAKSYRKKDSGKTDIQEVQNRILSSIVNLTKLFENGVLEVKNTTTGNAQGKIPNENMSDLQFPNKEDYSNNDEYMEDVKHIIFNWFMRDAVTNCILEALTMFWNLTKKDIQDVMSKVYVETDEKGLAKIAEARAKLIEELQKRVHPAAARLDFKKLVLGE